MSWFSKLFGGRSSEGSAGMQMAAHSSGARTAKDPVCGMDVEVDKAAATSTYQGQTYYFCSPGCKTSFDQDPARYLGGKGESHGGHTHMH